MDLLTSADGASTDDIANSDVIGNRPLPPATELIPWLVEGISRSRPASDGYPSGLWPERLALHGRDARMIVTTRETRAVERWNFNTVIAKVLARGKRGGKTCGNLLEVGFEFPSSRLLHKTATAGAVL